MKMENWTVAIAVALFVLCLFGIPLWTEVNLEFWLSQLKGKPIDVPYWMAFIVTVCFNAITLFFNIITEIYKLTN